MKSLLIKTYKDGGDPYEAILEQWNTPRQDTEKDVNFISFCFLNMEQKI